MDEKEQKRLKSEVRRLARIVRFYERGDELVDRVVNVVKDAMGVYTPINAPILLENTYEAGSDESALLLMSDVHIGKRTTSYNPKVFVRRLNTLLERVLAITTMHRSVRPIKELVVVMNGDLVDAEAVYPSQAVDHIAIPVLDQLYTVGLPNLVRFLKVLLENFETVRVIGNKGNHGRQNAAKWSSSKSTNWDYVLLKSLEAALPDPRLLWQIPTKDWKSIFTVQGHGFLATHGDMIKTYYNLPFYGMTRQAERWQNAYKEKKLSNFLLSHFHSAQSMRWNRSMIHVNGAFTTDDPYAEEHLGVASVPEQLFMGVHPKYGMSWRYQIRLE